MQSGHCPHYFSNLKTQLLNSKGKLTQMTHKIVSLPILKAANPYTFPVQRTQCTFGIAHTLH